MAKINDNYLKLKAGYLFPEVAIQTQLDLAQKQGATVWTSSKVTAIQAQGEYFQILVEGLEQKNPHQTLLYTLIL